MKKNWRLSALLALFLGFLTLPMLAAADDHAKGSMGDGAAPPPTLVEMWMVRAKPGHNDEFETKLKEFIAWRKANGDPMRWTVWTSALGDELGTYGIRSQQIHWKDLDAAREWGRKSKSGEQYDKLLAPHVDTVSRYFDEFDPELSRWVYEGEPNYVGVSVVKVLPGKWGEVKEALKTFKKAADDQKWSESWALMYNIGGAGGMVFAWPYANYADMDEPEMTASVLLEKALGSKEKAGEVMKSYGSGVERLDYTIWAYRPDLSTQKD